jgi:signal transduction histidine kinase
LIGIRERVANLSGTLRIESAHGKGTRLTVECPVRFRTSDAGSPAQATAGHPSSSIEAVRG